MMDAGCRSLSVLKKKEILQVLGVVRKEFMLLEGKVELLTEDRYLQTFKFLKDNFVEDEPVYGGLGVNWSSDIERDGYLPSFNANLSLVLVDPESDEIIATRITAICKRGESKSRDNMEAICDPALRELFRMEKVANDAVKFHDRYGLDEFIDFLGLCVHRKYRGRGIATKLVKFQIRFLELLDISPLYVKVQATSNYSKQLYENLGFLILHELKYDGYAVNGQQVLADTGVHKSMKTYSYRIK